MRILKSSELHVIAGGLEGEFEDFGDEDSGLDGVIVRGRRMKKKSLLSNIFDRWGEVLNPIVFSCPIALGDVVVANEKLDIEIVVEAKKISADQIKDFGMLFPQPTGNGQWTGYSDMSDAWGDLFKTMTTENLEAIRQALAQMIDNANSVNNPIAVGKLCALVTMIWQAMTGEGDRAELGQAFGQGLFFVHGNFGVSLLPLVKAFEGK